MKSKASRTGFPANWIQGEDVVVSPAIPTDVAKEQFRVGMVEIRPCLRMTPDPDK